MTRVPRRVRPTRPTYDAFRERASMWYANYRLEKRIKIEQEGASKENPGYRKKLINEIIERGKVIDPAGHKAILFDEPVDGLFGLKAQRAVSPGWENMLAVAVLREKGVEVMRACMSTQWQFRPDAVPLIVETLRNAGVLDDCVADDYPKSDIDPDLVLQYHQLHPDVITEKEMDMMMPDDVKWSIHPLTEPLGDVGDFDE